MIAQSASPRAATDRSAAPPGLDALDRELDPAGAGVSLANDQNFLARLADLDSGLADDNTPAAPVRPPLEATLVLPPFQAIHRDLPHDRATGSAGHGEPVDAISGWVMTVALVVLMLLGGAAAVLVFHERVAQIALQLDIAL